MENFDLNAIELGDYAKDSYLAYSVSVLRDRAIAYLHDGQKPVQRRILYVMNELGLVYDSPAKKSARIVGDIIGKYHPHGDSSVYSALVRMSQDFQLRYPLVNGQGNFGTINGDTAAAMRYTEARLTKISSLLLSELKYTGNDFINNYDNSEKEPENLPARLNMLLMNGVMGIAVGMATNIPAHNIQNVSDATISLIKNPNITIEELIEDLKGPDFAKGGQIITPKSVIIENYKKGRGAFVVRCKWRVEKLARGQYQIVIYELPPSLSPNDVLDKIEAITNPKVAKDKKTGKPQKLTQKQINDKQLLSSLISNSRDDSDKDLRVLIEPRSSKQDPEELMNSLYKMLGLEENFNMNLVAVGLNSRPALKNIKEILQEWVDFRFITLTKRTQFLLDKAQKRIHILEGREIAYNSLDEVIDTIRTSEDAKSALIEKFSLTEIQAEDILEIKLRSLARMEIDKILKELMKLKKEESYYKDLLASDRKMKNLMIKEIKEDTKEFSDERRTLIEEAEIAKTIDPSVALAEKMTLIYTKSGWLTQRRGFEFDVSSTVLKDGDEVEKVMEGKTNQQVVVLSSSGRLFNFKLSEVASGKNFNHINSIISLGADSVVDIMFIEEFPIIITGGFTFGYIFK